MKTPFLTATLALLVLPVFHHDRANHNTGAAFIAAAAETGGFAPNFAFNGPDGRQNLADFRGNVVVLSFWASWCPPCRRELPAMHLLARKYKNNGVIFLGINNEDPIVAQKINNVGMFFTTVDINDEISNLYGVDSLPTTIIIAGDGTVAATFVGFQRADSIESAILAVSGR